MVNAVAVIHFLPSEPPSPLSDLHLAHVWIYCMVTRTHCFLCQLDHHNLPIRIHGTATPISGKHFRGT